MLGDRDALRQALANLLANAIRLAPEGSTVRRARRAGRRLGVGGGRRPGPGIAAEDQASVFQRFWRATPAGPAASGAAGSA